MTHSVISRWAFSAAHGEFITLLTNYERHQEIRRPIGSTASAKLERTSSFCLANLDRTPAREAVDINCQHRPCKGKIADRMQNITLDAVEEQIKDPSALRISFCNKSEPCRLHWWPRRTEAINQERSTAWRQLESERVHNWEREGERFPIPGKDCDMITQ